MKIVHLIVSVRYMDGWGYQENTLPQEQLKRGNEITILTTTNSSIKPTEREKTEGCYELDGIHIIRMKETGFFKQRQFAKYNNICTELEKILPDLIFVHGVVFLSIKELDMYCKKHPMTVVLGDTHSDYVNSFNKLVLFNKAYINFYTKRLYKKYEYLFNTIYYVAPQCKRFLEEIYDANPNILKYLPLSNSPIYEESQIESVRVKKRNELHLLKDDIVFVSGGRHRRSKNILQLVKGFSNNNAKNSKLILFGNWEDEEYKSEVYKEIGGDERIIDIGWQNNKQIEELFYASDCGLFPGTQSILWRIAVSCGMPVVCHYTEGAEELNLGGNAIILNSDEGIIWNIIIEKMINNQSLLLDMKKVANEKGRYFFSNKRLADIIDADYHNAISAKLKQKNNNMQEKQSDE